MDRGHLNDLMQAAAAGEANAFAAVALDAQDELFRLALAHGLSREDAADAVQEALLRAHRRRSDWRSGSDALAWLCGFLINVARECRRANRRRVDALQRGSERSQRPDTAPPDVVAMEADQSAALLEAVAALPPRQREAIACRYLRRMDIRQTAEAMGCAEGTVKSAVNAALHALRSVLESRP